MGYVRTTKRSRKTAYPNSILDRTALVQALEDRGLIVKHVHITAFYQALHRQNYPSLEEFVENYHRHEDEVVSRSIQLPSVQRPLRNKVSSRKNKNKVQLPKGFIAFLSDPGNGFVTIMSKVAQQSTSADGTTTKLAIQLHDGQLVESVLMRYVSSDGSRASLCVSSQCGCAMGCTFCATGTMGLSGNLSSAEILEQIVHADRILAQEWEEHKGKENPLNLEYVRNVVFMGMGEPLDNYNNVVAACRALIDNKRWNLAHGRITVSTVGIVNKIRKLTEDLPEVSLALSLHAPNQELRTAIVPTAKVYPIEDLIDALDEHMMAYVRKKFPDSKDYSVEQRIEESTRRRAMIEYVMLEGPTSSFECAHELGRLCQNRHLVVNLIPYNQTDVKDVLRCPSMEHIEEFKRIVGSYGTFVSIRRTMGADIAGACGQLVKKKKGLDMKNFSVVVPDIEDGPVLSSSIRMEQQQQESPSPLRKTKPLIARKEEKEEEEETCHVQHDLDYLIRPLAVATTIAASCFIVSSILFLRQKRK